MKLTAIVVLLAALLAPAAPGNAAVRKTATVTPTTGYSHLDELDFNPHPDNRTAAGKQYPILRSVEPCVDGYMPRVFARYSTTKPVLVCW